MRASTFGTPEYDARRKAMEAANKKATEEAAFRRDLDIGNARRAWNYRNEAKAPAKLDPAAYRDYIKQRKFHSSRAELLRGALAEPTAFSDEVTTNRQKLLAESEAWLAGNRDPAYMHPTRDVDPNAWARGLPAPATPKIDPEVGQRFAQEEAELLKDPKYRNKLNDPDSIRWALEDLRDRKAAAKDKK
jgi:hypothetical protein